MFSSLKNLGTYDQRKIKNDQSGGGVVNTASVYDSPRPYETGIKHPNYRDGKWIIVECYDSMEEALAGHQKWVDHLSQNPKALTDVSECEIAQSADALANALGRPMTGVFPRQ